MAQHAAGGAGLAVACWLGHDVGFGDESSAFLLDGFAQFVQADMERVDGDLR